MANRILPIVPSLLVNDSVYTLTQTIRPNVVSTTSSIGEGGEMVVRFLFPILADPESVESEHDKGRLNECVLRRNR